MLEDLAFEREWWPEQEDEVEDKDSYDSKSLRLAASFLEMLVLKSQGEIDLSQDEAGAIYAKPAKAQLPAEVPDAPESAIPASTTSITTDKAEKSKLKTAATLRSMQTLDSLSSMTPRVAGVL